MPDPDDHWLPGPIDLPPEEYSEWNHSDLVESMALLPELLAAQATKTPDSIALVSQGNQLTYAELAAQSNRLARMLVGLNVRTESMVAVVMPRSTDLVVALVAVLKAGGSYLPVDPEYPGAHIDYLLEDSAPVAVITTVRLSPLINAGSAPAILLDEPSTLATLTQFDGSDLESGDLLDPLLPEHAAYLMYTSGSTGRPKGVIVPHRALANYVASCREAYPELGGRTLLHAPISVDAGITTLYGALTLGGRVHLAPLDEELPSLIAHERFTFLKLTPTHLPLLEVLPDGCAPTGCLMMGGEGLPTSMAQVWLQKLPGVRLVNHYGPTEVTVGCADYVIPMDSELSGSYVPIGRPMWNIRIFVLNERLEPVLPGVLGELYIAGVQLARGYHGRPGLTAERFVACPFGPPGSRMYRTGDRATWTIDGQLVFAGRVDDQLKIRGFRVEPAEVEKVLLAHPQVARAVTIVLGDRLVAYVVPSDHSASDKLATDVRDHAARYLPRHMTPAAVVVLDSFPMTMNGKLDRNALPAPKTNATSRDSSGRTELTALARELAAIVGTIIEHDVEPQDHILEAGAQSTHLARLAVVINRRYGVKVRAVDIFDSPTPAELAELVSNRQRDGTG